MRSRHFLSLFLAVSVVATVASAAITPFRDGERVVFLGDSITAFNHYIADVQFFMDRQRGERAPYFMNCGTAGDAAGSAVDRIACDLMPMRPERVIVMLGMNDVAYDRWKDGKATPQLESAITAYGRNMRVLVDALLARGLKVDLMTPSPFDEYSTDLKRPTRPGCNEVGLTRLAAHVRALAAEKNLGLVEVHAPMTAIEKTHPTGLHYSGADRVHPSLAGNRFLAAAVLTAADEVPGVTLTEEGVEKLFAIPKGSDAERLWTAMAPVRKEMERLRSLVYCDRFVKGMTGKEVDLANIVPAADAVDKWVAAELARGTESARAKRLERVKAEYRENRTKMPAYLDALEKLHQETLSKWLATQDDLAVGFLAPPHAAKPHTWYHMMNGNVTKEGITRDFEALAEIGVGGVQMFDAGCEIPAGPLKFNSPEWFELIRHAASEARRLGLEICLPNCSGWSSSGGPWVKPEDGMMELVWTAGENVVGPTNVNGRLEAPPFASPRAPFYRDLAVIAVPVPPAELRTFEGSSETLEGMQARFTAPAPVTSGGLCLRYRYGPTYGIYGKLLVEASDDGTHFREIGRFESNPCVLCTRDESVRTIRFAKRETYRILRVKYLFEKGSIVQAKLRIEDLRPTDRAELTNARVKRLVQRDAVVRDTFSTRPDEVVASAACVNLTSALKPDGSLAWVAPVGTWRLYRLGYRANGRQNHPASTCGIGLEVNKLSAAALARHFDNYVGRLCETLGPGLCGARRYGLNNILVDSYEVGSQTWTHGFERIFRERMGYDLAPYYPVLLGFVVDSTNVSERFLEDYRRVLCDLFAENYGKVMAKVCHARGLKLSLEPYGNGPSDNLQYGEAVDIPMGEFWSHSRNPWPNACGNVKQISALAHFWGRRIVGAEAFTASGSRASRSDNGPDTGGWTTTPFDLKAQGDAAYCAGVNRIIYHRFVHQPWAKTPRLPGMTMGKWGMHFDRTQTWWQEGRDWITYQSRCQWMMQEGTFVADFLVYCGEDAPNRSGCPDDSTSVSPADVLPTGYDYDLAAREALKALKVEEGALVSPAGMRYRVLVLPTNDTMSLDMLQTVERLVAAGACVVGPVKPSRVPGLAGGAARAAEMLRLADKVWAKGVLPNVAAAVTKLGLTPDCTLTWQGKPVGLAPHWIHRRNAAADWYFVAANNRAETAFTASLRGTYPVVELWDAERGTIRRARRVRQVGGRTVVTFELPIAGSVFLVGRSASDAPVEPAMTETAATVVAGPWNVSFPKDFKPNALAKAGCEKLVFDSLIDWAKHPADGVRHFSGTAVYAKTLVLDATTRTALAAGSRLTLDLGDVRHFATVTVNGKTYPALWKPPYRVDITDALQPTSGDVQITIRVTNLWANKLIDDAGKPEDCAWEDKTIHGRAIRVIPDWVWTDQPSPTRRDTFVTWEHWKGTDRLQPSGMIGHVRLVRRDPMVPDVDSGTAQFVREASGAGLP